MRILIDINHPAHVHYFRNFYEIMTSMGHHILVVSRNKEIEHSLLKLYAIPFVDRGKGKAGRFGKFLYLMYADIKLFLLARKFKPDLFLNFLHPYPSHVAALLGKTSLVFSDTEHATLHHKLTVPFATKILTPSCYRIDLGKKHIRFNSFMELCYLHPNYFHPDPSILTTLNVCEGEKFVIVRFVSWEAVHDFSHSGMTIENKRKAVLALSEHARVFISAESKLPDDLEKFRIKIPFNKMHDALYYASLLFGESATMASEAAVLGTPSIFVDNDGRGYIDEEATRYQLVHNFTESETDQKCALQKALEIIRSDNGKEKYQVLRNALLSNCIDTTRFMVDQVLQYEN
ncbi:MAG TPA: DUF354 domain-containing protein [Niastella sp.]